MSYVERILASRDNDDALSELLMDELRCRGLCEEDAAQVTGWYVQRALDEYFRGEPS